MISMTYVEYLPPNSMWNILYVVWNEARSHHDKGNGTILRPEAVLDYSITVFCTQHDSYTQETTSCKFVSNKTLVCKQKTGVNYDS